MQTPIMGQLYTRPQQWVSYILYHNDGSPICSTQRWVGYVTDPNDESLPPTMTHLVFDPSDESPPSLAPNTESLNTRLPNDLLYLASYGSSGALNGTVRFLWFSEIRRSYLQVTYKRICLNSPCSANHSQVPTRISNPYHTVVACNRVTGRCP